MYREPTVTERQPGLKSMVWIRRKKETFNQNRMKKQEIIKMRRGLGNSRKTLNILTSNHGSTRSRRGKARNRKLI